MKILERLNNGIGTGSIRGIYEASDGRHRCTRCNKQIRISQEVIEDWGPDTRYRRTNYWYTHLACPMELV